MKNINWQRALPYVLIFVGFLVIAYAFMSPVLSGKRLYQYDIVQSMGMNKEIVDLREKEDRQTLWTNRPFAGMPAFLLSVKFKNNILYHVNSIFGKTFSLNKALNRSAYLVFLMLFAFFIAARMMGIEKWLSAIGAIAFGLSTYWLVSLEAGHNSKIVTYAFMAPTIASLAFAYRKNAALGALFFAIFFGFSINGHHTQVTYYTFLIGAIYFISEAIFNIKNKNTAAFLKTTALLFGGAILAIGLNANQLYSTYVHSKETTRGGKSELIENTKDSDTGLGYNYATAWSYGIKETGTLLIPNFAGGASQGPLTESSATYDALLKNRMPKSQAKKTIQQLPIYFGEQSFTAGPTYSGAIICFLFLLAMFVLPNRHRWWILAATLLSMFLAWGNKSVIFDFFYYYVPLFNKFRAPAMALSILTFLLPFAAIMGVSQFFDKEIDKSKLKKALIISGAITAGFTLLTLLFGGMFWDYAGPSDSQLPKWLIEPIKADRASVLKADALRSLIFIALAFGALWFYLKEKINTKIVLAVLALTITGDLFSVGKRYVTESDFRRQRDIDKSLRPQFNDAQMRTDKSQFRVWNTNSSLDKDALTSYNYNSLSGYSAAKLLLFQDLIDNQLSRGSQPVLNMLNTKYIVQKQNAQLNSNACGNVWFADKITYANNAKEVMNKISTFDACNEAIVENKIKSKIGNVATSGNGNINLAKYEADKLTYNVNTNKSRLAVFSEIYYNAGGGWKATIDGKVAEVLKVNYALRGLVIPKGAKKIVFEFNPSFYRTGETISLIFSILLIVLLGAYFYFNRKLKVD